MSRPRILIIKLSSLGDILHVLPTVQALHEQLGATIDWAVQPEYVPLVQCFSAVEQIIAVPRHGLLGEFRKTWSAIRACEYDMAIDLHGLFKSAWVTRAARTKRRIGPSYARELSGWAYTERTGHMNRERHAVEQAMDVLDHLGLKRPITPAVTLHYPTVVLPAAPLRICFSPVSRWQTKNWPAAHFARLAQRLVNELGARVFVLGTQTDLAVGETICGMVPESTLNLCGKYSIPELFSVLQQCDLLIANDTGPVHMAAALGKPCLVLFGPTRPERTGPYGKGHRILMHNLSCQPCLSRHCRRGDHTCLTGISPDEVYDAACTQLGQSPEPQSVRKEAPHA